MRAAVITEPGGPEVLKIMEVDDPVPGPEDVLIDVKATALNRADMLQRQGGYPAPPGSPSDIPGLEFAGIVLEAGDRVMGMAEGDRVFGLLGGGGYASRTVTHHRMAIPIPDGWDFVQAAATPEVFFTAYDALFNRGNLQMGERVLVHAAGSGVGTAAIQLAHHAGAFVFGTAGSAKKLAGAAELGLDVGINYHDQDFAAVVKEHTAGAGVDVLIDFIGGPYWDQNIASMAILGRLVEVGLMGGGRVEVDLGQLMAKRLQVTGTGLRSRSIEEKLAVTAQFKRHVLPHLASGSMKPVVDRTFPLEEAAEAHRYMETNANFGKIVLTID
ncbi:MAG: NAD(P)H-quinone oxidoreductase [Chloroflexi bacterium]|nr:NAD(P)H-quinone oxidoreductase [Chloroflexota bacterium]MCI0812165.1 NAD(P)H-quinone oxidoreductase [Chloroflexota bacterium]MCI0848527.1 NAD(P)H-quinone oxidoreductase [Chloroflexota bacterium]MCI0899057.1 NAD(P)H-quinone oxidoreductase [Chloroflexota bacterium]MCI0900254.1 NAD(P)H-quinone oxidoreductase [Chloroflexota bacterium]